MSEVRLKLLYFIWNFLDDGSRLGRCVCNPVKHSLWGVYSHTFPWGVGRKEPSEGCGEYSGRPLGLYKR